MRLRILITVLASAAAAIPGVARATTPACDAPFVPATGIVATHTCTSESLFGDTTFTYFVPETCEPCPLLYLLHGFGGDHTSMLGTPESPSAFVRALEADPVTGDALDPIDLILVAPSGRTVETAGPSPAPAGLEGFWVDWNPRYTDPAPRFEAFVREELRELVEGSFPTLAERAWRAIDGVSLGGFGSFKLAFQHPDLYATAGSISGALNILVAPGPQPVAPMPFALGGWPAPAPYTQLPGVISTPPGFPFGDPFRTFGDPVADEWYYRGNNPLDLAVNAAGVPMRFFHNDTLSRDPAQDLADPAGFFGAYLLETIVMPMNLEMVATLTQHGTPFEHEIHPGLHAGRYWDPYIREQLEWHDARLRAEVPAPPEVFTYRSIRDVFSVWGWDVTVSDREPGAFTTLWDASLDGFAVSGSGTVTITTPPTDFTGMTVQGGCCSGSLVHEPGGRAQITIELGPSPPTDDHAGASGIAAINHTARITFDRG